MVEYSTLTKEDLIKRLKWLGFGIIILGTLVYLYSQDLENLAGKVVNNHADD